jgi:hypothetical protein
VVEREAPGDFDYLWDDPADVEGPTSDGLQAEPDDDGWDEPGYHFDPFNDNTWSFTPPPAPWYRTKHALTAIIAAGAAMAAIVVAGVLLVFSGPAKTVDDRTSPVTPTAPTSDRIGRTGRAAAPVQAQTSARPPAPLPPPPPETVASPVNPAPVYNPTAQPRPAKGPEINVTRSPMSVSPQPRTPPNQRH